MIKDITEKAVEFFNSNTKEDCYEFAIELLYRLKEKHYCIWQTYSKEDLKTLIGRNPTKDEFSGMQERLANSSEYILLEV